MLSWHCLATVNSQSHDDNDISDDLWCCWQEAAFLAWKSLQRSDLFLMTVTLQPNTAVSPPSSTCIQGEQVTRGQGEHGELPTHRCSTSCWPGLMAAQPKPSHQNRQQQMGGAHLTPALQSYQNILSSNIWLCDGAGIIRNQLCTNNNCWSEHRLYILYISINNVCGVGDHSEIFNILHILSL